MKVWDLLVALQKMPMDTAVGIDLDDLIGNVTDVRFIPGDETNARPDVVLVEWT